VHLSSRSYINLLEKRVRMKSIASVALSILLGAAVVPCANADSIYPLNGSFADTDGSGPALVPDGGALGPTGYAFQPNQGLHVSNVLANPGTYSIELTFQLTDTSGYRKLIDFNDLTSDNGLYVINGLLQFYPTTPSVPVFSNSQLATVLLTRDSSTTLVNGYVNGVLRISFSDSAGIGIFSSSGNIIRFFEDDAVTTAREASAGFVDQIRIADNSNGVFSSSAVTPLPSAATAGLGLLALVGARRRARRPL
jgi:hypothetical protein